MDRLQEAIKQATDLGISPDRMAQLIEIEIREFKESQTFCELVKVMRKLHEQSTPLRKVCEVVDDVVNAWKDNRAF
jgi:FtsZ-binding cell division protein ZapB